MVGIGKRNQILTRCFAKPRFGEKLIQCFGNFRNKNQCLLIRKIVEKPSILHLLQCNLLDWDQKAQNNKSLQRIWVLLFGIQISTLFLTTHSGSSCEETKWYSITLTIMICCNTFDFILCIHSHINHILQPSFHIYVSNTYACLKFSIIGVSTSLKIKDSCLVYSFNLCFTFTFFLGFFYSFPLLSSQQVPSQILHLPIT